MGRKGFKQSEASAESMEAQLMLILSGKYDRLICRSTMRCRGYKRKKLRCPAPTEYGYQAPFSLIFCRGRSKETLISRDAGTVRARVKG